MPSIIATGSKTIIDLSDGKTLSVYLGSNQPRTQILDLNTGVYTPDWSDSTQQPPGTLVITPVIYAGSQQILTTDTHLQTVWKRRAGSGDEENLTNNEVVSGNVLTVNANKLASISSGLLTYVVRAAYVDPDTGLTINATADLSFSLVKTGQSAKTAWISGEQVFKYSVDGTVTPSQIVLTANLQGVTMTKWQYKNSSNVWTDFSPAETSTTLTVQPTSSIWNDDTATVQIITSDVSIYDVMSLYKIRDGAQGQPGTPASTVLLTNENITFAADKDGEVPATTSSCKVVAYTGTNKVAPTVGTVTGMPTGMSVVVGQADQNDEIPLTITITAGSTLGGASEQNGVLTVPVTSPISTSLQIHWSKVNTGLTGSNGENAVVFTVYAPGGTTFVNQEGELLLATQAYDGSTAIVSGASYQWSVYEQGAFSPIQGATSSTYEVQGTAVASTGTFKCTMTYKNNPYSDVITLVDKTDNYQAEIESTGGDIFKNTQGTSYLTCRLWQNGSEVDTQKAAIYGTAPGSPSEGDMYYTHTSGTHVAQLMRYNGTTWVNVTSDPDYAQSKTYTWYRRDKDGEPLDNGNSFATGKVVYVDGNDVDVKTVFTCEVS